MRFRPDDADRERLREVHGAVIEGADALRQHLRDRSWDRLITVGDRVTIDLADGSLHPDIAITDGREQRSPVADGRHDDLDPDISLTAWNPAGSITEGGWSRTRAALAHDCRVRLRIDGEEDLLALPAILSARTDDIVVYGHWQHGAVVVRPDQEMKDWVREIVEPERADHLIVGGTWDRFHAGHRYLLLAALEYGHRVSVGITSDRFAAAHTDHAVEPFEERKANVSRFLRRQGDQGRTEAVEIDDIHGPAANEGDALLVTADTRANGERVNEHRRQAGREPLELIEADRITGTDGQVISSSRVRDGAIDREGRAQERGRTT